MTIVFGVLGLLVLFVLIVLVRTLLFRPRPQKGMDAPPVSVDAARAVESLSLMLQCKTVSYRDAALELDEAFAAFEALLQARYPHIHRVCTKEKVHRRGLLFHWKGESNEAPSVYMSHYDVVPADETLWAHPPFSGLVENGEIWGRGAFDTKCTLCAALEAAETLIAQGFVPKNDVYFAFGGDEEVAGMDAPAIMALLHTRGVRPALVLDEGGTVTAGVFPGVTEKAVLIGTSEKGMLDLEFKLTSPGGHASCPPPHTPVGELAQAVTRLENKPFSMELVPPIREMFDTLGRYSTFAYRLLFANLWCFSPILNAITKKRGGELNAFVRTTCACTMMQGSPAVNVIPSTATVNANFRLMGGDTVEKATKRIVKTIANPNIKLHMTDGHDPSPFTATTSPGYLRVKSAAARTWPGAVISPYLMVACTDARHFTKISDTVIRFSAIEMTAAQRKRMHGIDERIGVQEFTDTVRFYTQVIMDS